MYDSNGDKDEGKEEIKKHLVQHFKNLCADTDETDPISQDELLSFIPSKIMDDDNEELVRPISEQEISDAIWSLQLDKAPSPDGFIIIFYRVVWEIIKANLRRMLNCVGLLFLTVHYNIF